VNFVAKDDWRRVFTTSNGQVPSMPRAGHRNCPKTFVGTYLVILIDNHSFGSSDDTISFSIKTFYYFSASARISKGQGYQVFFRKRAGSSFGRKSAICVVQGKTWKDRQNFTPIVLGSIMHFMNFLKKNPSYVHVVFATLFSYKITPQFPKAQAHHIIHVAYYMYCRYVIVCSASVT
jgi:hypothetical protein